MKKKKGYSLALVLIITSILLVLLAVSGTIMVSEAKQSIFQQKKTQAHYIARAGASAAGKWLTSMSSAELEDFNSLTFPLHSNAQSFNEGLFEITIDKNAGGLVIEARGKVPNGKNSDGSQLYVTDTVKLVLSAKESSISEFDVALFGNRSIDLSGGADIYGDIGINNTESGSVSIDGGASINGTVYIPNGGNPDLIVSTSRWTSKPEIKHFVSNKNYPSPVLPQFPDGLPVRASITLRGNNSAVINSDGYYESITIQANNTLTIDAANGDRVIRINELDVQQGIIKINGSGKVILYIDNLISLKGTINSDGNAEQLVLYCDNIDSFKIAGGTSINGSLYFGNTDLNISGGAVINGDIVTAGDSVNFSGGSYTDPKVIYAPNANINISGGAVIDGAIIGNSISASGGSTVKLTEPVVEIQVPIITENSSDSGYELDYWK